MEGGVKKWFKMLKVVDTQNKNIFRASKKLTAWKVSCKVEETFDKINQTNSPSLLPIRGQAGWHDMKGGCMTPIINPHALLLLVVCHWCQTRLKYFIFLKHDITSNSSTSLMMYIIHLHDYFTSNWCPCTWI